MEEAQKEAEKDTGQVPFSWSSCSSRLRLVSGQGGKSRPPAGGLRFPPGLQIPADLGPRRQAVGAETGQERTGGAGWRNRVGKVVGRRVSRRPAA